MAKEVEVKILDINIDEIRKKFLALGAEEKPEALVIEEIFDWPDRSIKEWGEVLRLRKVGDKVELVYKVNPGQDGKFKVREELEVQVSNFEKAKQILLQLGLKIFQHREKKRMSFKLGRARLEIDKYPTIPAYLEIEAPSEELVKETVERLGHTMEQTTTLFAGGALRQYGQRSQIIKDSKDWKRSKEQAERRNLKVHFYSRP